MGMGRESIRVREIIYVGFYLSMCHILFQSLNLCQVICISQIKRDSSYLNK